MFAHIQRRIAALVVRPHAPARTIRLRLTVIYGALFLICGAGLLAITYALMLNVSGDACYTGPDGLNICTTNSGGHGPLPGTAPQSLGGGGQTLPTPEQMSALAMNQHAHEMHQLLVRSGIALAIMAAVSIALGWLVAGRVLRPLRKITEATQAISATNLHERLALAGPDDELKKLADTIDGLVARLEGAFEAQRRFVANASHELRTPLTFVRALLQMTLTDPDATLDTFRTTCQDILVEGERQERLIDALLVLARSERGLDHREPFDLSSIVETVLPALRPKADQLRIKIQTSLHSAPAEGDTALAEQLVANLIDNALRYNVARGHIDITTGTTAGRPFVSISNAGTPVPPRDVDRLFLPFQRLGADSTDNSDGLGLGLSIVQAIADAHQASITAHARPNGGLRIDISFPRPAPTSGTYLDARHIDQFAVPGA
ncbi:MAG: sensor histidine kinase [Sciscionella sp.]